MQQALRYSLALLCALLSAALLWLCIRFLLPWSAPFLFAYGAAAALERPVRALVRRGIKRRFAAAFVTLSALALLCWGAGALALKAAGAAAEFAKRAPELMLRISAGADALEARLLEYIAAAPEGAGEYLASAFESAEEELYAIPTYISQHLLDFAAKLAQMGPNILLFTVTAGIGTYFISAAFPQINSFVMAQLPIRLRRRFEGLGRDLKASFGGYLRSQLILMGITFAELVAAFLLLGVENLLPIAAITAVVDALPVFGTGTVLLPWAVYSFAAGNAALAAGLLITWAAVNLVRSCIQARLLGAQIGLDPLASLIAVYIGWKAWGVAGMLTFPIILVSLRQLNDRGVIKLWKNV